MESRPQASYRNAVVWVLFYLPTNTVLESFRLVPLLMLSRPQPALSFLAADSLIFPRSRSL